MSVTAGVGEEAARPSSGCDDAPSPHRSEATCPARRESESGIAVYRRHQASTKIVAGLNFSPSMLLSAQWRGGSTVTEQLVFTTCKEGVFVLDEPAAVAKVLGSSLSHGRVVPDAIRPEIAAANADALACNFSRFDTRALVGWQRERVHLTGLSAHPPTSYDHLLQRCLHHKPEHRAIKTIRVAGHLKDLERILRGENVRVIQLLRHPISLLRSRIAAITATESPTQAPTGLETGLQRESQRESQTESGRMSPRISLAIPKRLRGRADLNLTHVCGLLLRDVITAYQMRRRGQRILLLRSTPAPPPPASTAPIIPTP